MSEYGRVHLEHAEVTGERVRLRPNSLADAPACFELLHDEPRITDWILWDGPQEIADVERMFEPWSKERETLTSYSFGIEERASGQWAGCLGLKHQRDEPVASVWYLAGVPYQGRGLTSEAVQLAVELAFRELDVLLIQAGVFVENHASIRVLEKVGMRRDESCDSTHEKGGEMMTAHGYSISRAVWEAGAPPAAEWVVRSSRAD